MARAEITHEMVTAFLNEISADVQGAKDKAFLRVAMRSHALKHFRVTFSQTIETALDCFFRCAI